MVSGSWATIIGTELATTTQAWSAGDFLNGKLPPSLASTGVVINGKQAFVSYVSYYQINALVPDDATTGPVTVIVTEAFTTSNIFITSKAALAPALFTTDGTHAVTYPAGPAKPGDVVMLFGTGFGATSPAIPTGFLFDTPARVAQAVTATVGGVDARVEVWLTFPGVYQVNLTVPDVPGGDHALEMRMGSSASQTGLLLPISRQAENKLLRPGRGPEDY
jgi:uncharacterized protein (TIGR03437 family)